MSEKNLETVRRLQERFAEAAERGDFAAFRSSDLVASDFEFHPAPELDQDTYRGADGFETFMHEWTEDFEDWSWRIERLIDTPGDRVVAFMHQSGTGKASGAPVDLHYGAVFELQEGRVTRISLYLDPDQALEAAGVSG